MQLYIYSFDSWFNYFLLFKKFTYSKINSLMCNSMSFDIGLELCSYKWNKVTEGFITQNKQSIAAPPNPYFNRENH